MPTEPYDTAKPSDTGGPVARRGFRYQDHVMVSFMLQMLDDPRLEEAWAEYHDDIFLVWQLNTGKTLEFVQVKSEKLTKGLWTIAKLIEDKKAPASPKRKKTKRSTGTHASKRKKHATSLLGRSLGQDRLEPAAVFRVITLWQINLTELGVLDARDVEVRAVQSTDCATTKKLGDELAKRTKNSLKSGAGNCVRYWAARASWEVWRNQEDVKARNILALNRHISQWTGHAPLTAENTDLLYQAMLDRATQTGTRSEEETHKIKQSELALWAQHRVRAYQVAQNPYTPKLIRVENHGDETKVLIRGHAHDERMVVPFTLETGGAVDVTVPPPGSGWTWSFRTGPVCTGSIGSELESSLSRKADGFIYRIWHKDIDDD